MLFRSIWLVSTSTRYEAKVKAGKGRWVSTFGRTYKEALNNAVRRFGNRSPYWPAMPIRVYKYEKFVGEKYWISPRELRRLGWPR